MDKVFVKVDIVDNDYDKATDRVMNTYILVNPDFEKLDKLQQMLKNRFVEQNEFADDYGAINDYIKENFDLIDITYFVEIEW